MTKTKIAPSILSADFRQLEAEIRKVEAAGADLIHIDVMDGHFVPNITIGPLIVKACRQATKLPLDVHLMIENPDRYIPDFAKAGADIITIHVETVKNLEADIELIKRNGVKPGAVINPATPVESVFHVLDKVSMVLLMSVNPGFEGQKFMPEVLPKIKALRSLVVSRKLSVDIEVDGGINLESAGSVVKAGANVLVAGSAIFYAKDYRQIITRLKNA
ncbi:MAG: ribulose-phosphate 3-epimerase [Candidatus Margulisbacteria bacterium]|jgi:ribulose-phosphate 3-epimerase|nr:ribulose-phosphate 3-epimerase [Candidatus Margulisiibacteriota bacterium]